MKGELDDREPEPPRRQAAGREGQGGGGQAWGKHEVSRLEQDMQPANTDPGRLDDDQLTRRPFARSLLRWAVESAEAERPAEVPAR
jgi:hypothetical protein